MQHLLQYSAQFRVWSGYLTVKRTGSQFPSPQIFLQKPFWYWVTFSSASGLSTRCFWLSRKGISSINCLDSKTLVRRGYSWKMFHLSGGNLAMLCPCQSKISTTIRDWVSAFNVRHEVYNPAEIMMADSSNMICPSSPPVYSQAIFLDSVPEPW